ncbi:MAG: competence/damage-inducible protein A [Gammaproteobacteria bacterium]|nr:competence/damage-inducible protein A [Rhodocyclaceae bacterium]MBU3909453.1 competence/damage-inducible protein A [Gammaproteobacteria bacterium]MBU3988287.1 competence/damage-inducible protein A [Gammaproteobacteria bacterium]MBU4003631.1 competence/damage-inducible protein A [Gammaproteobacteria bacterium]MBU4021989.1 competence/damage-inducible protein A [Gammaproteobacteria bacterium]
MRTYGAIIIGDEIMRGKRQDKHFAKLIEIFATPERGLRLSWVQYLGDERPRLVEVLSRTLASGDVVFCFGGIGVTPDDHTRQAAALAAGVPLELNADAEREIRARMAEIGQQVTPARLELGTVPQGSRIIPNPFNRIPGFSLGDHHFLPGFPQMSWPMAEWVLDTYYRDDFGQLPEAEASILVWEGLEGLMLDLMHQVEADFTGLTVFSLPTLGSESVRHHVELGVRGNPAQVVLAIEVLKRGVTQLGYSFDANFHDA